ncbi:type II toxin-antitoxin system YhaV family toxin [Aerosakkonema sp. BLCC-F183]|uniref:type II toxin-antitoxin system YhaV family toxin n=1 Tax=Aerosakkonema sp. BLCC-F183 TaxID=3342834 RepID=UPI0035B83C48
MSYLIFNGWKIRFHPLFRQQWNDLLSDATKLKNRLSSTEYRSHPRVKLFAAVKLGIEEKIPSDPFSLRFSLKDDLRGYSRLKGMGLPNRYRLFFRASQLEDQKEADRINQTLDDVIIVAFTP